MNNQIYLKLKIIIVLIRDPEENVFKFLKNNSCKININK